MTFKTRKKSDKTMKICTNDDKEIVAVCQDFLQIFYNQTSPLSHLFRLSLSLALLFLFIFEPNKRKDSNNRLNYPRTIHDLLISSARNETFGCQLFARRKSHLPLLAKKNGSIYHFRFEEGKKLLK
jgi:hypothetical protein